jgi:hypothetical protein
MIEREVSDNDDGSFLLKNRPHLMKCIYSYIYMYIYIHRVLSLIFLLKLTLPSSGTMNACLLQTSSIRILVQIRSVFKVKGYNGCILIRIHTGTKLKKFLFFQEMFWFFSALRPARVQVRIDPSHPLMCSKRRLNGAVLQMRPEKPRPRVTAGVPR